MLTLKEYKTLWTSPIPHGFDKNIADIPPYCEYLQREVYQQDYLDLFTGKCTYERIKDKSGKWYVVVDQMLFMLETIDEAIGCNDLLIRVEKEWWLLVDYDFPYKDEIKNSKEREIKYILIGEAANKPNPKKIAYGVFDEENTYFYNILHIKSTAYFKAPCKAFKIDIGIKSENLITLADEGVLLLDLFPFAISYSDALRERLRYLALTRFKTYIIEELIINLLKLKPKSLNYSFLCNIHHAKGIILVLGNFYKLEDKTYDTWHKWALRSRFYLHAGRLPVRNYKVELTVPIDGFRFLNEYRAIGKDGSGTPHYIPIRFGFIYN